ncbi:MAG: LD-carboxypeptidase [Ignavibacteriaceae bacterium]|nr:LD-carboxypeptidase [Ignavibacteriaceae bacterium]
MKRRNFIKTVSAASAGVASVNATSFGAHTILEYKQIIKPPKLKEGDKLGLITPGSYISVEEKEKSIKNLKELGFEVEFSDKLMLMNGYFSGNDKERADDINEMFERDDIKGIVCARGGYGCVRTLKQIDYEIVRRNPKVLIGYSDVTALLYGIYKKTGLITFHGPVGISSYNNFSKKYFNQVLTKPTEELELTSSSSGNNENIYGTTTIISGTASGELVGGNLSIVVSLIGTEYDIDTKGKIIFLEEYIEEPYRIDRMLTQMIQAGKLSEAAGVALGIFRKCESKEENPSFSNSFTLMEVLKDRLSDLKIPVVYGLSFGHVKDKFTIPFGINAELDADNYKLKLLETAVI